MEFFQTQRNPWASWLFQFQNASYQLPSWFLSFLNPDNPCLSCVFKPLIHGNHHGNNAFYKVYFFNFKPEILVTSEFSISNKNL